MPEFISKLQHNTYEKGEFSDEKPRSLEDTLALIKNFPWDTERALTDIQLTGPSVTIRDEYVNYLKVGLFFNGKFCIYYMDNDNHLYEYHAPDIEDACRIVNDFFNSTLELSRFDRHIFNIGNQPHFVTSYFEYHIKPWRVIKLTGMLLGYSFLALLADIELPKQGIELPPMIFVGLISLLFYSLPIWIYHRAIATRNNYLQISKGNDAFSFGYTQLDIRTYNKKDIAEIVVYANRGSRNPILIEVYDINFKNGDSIRFSNMLIPDTAFHTKFSDSMNNLIIPFTPGKKSILKVL